MALSLAELSTAIGAELVGPGDIEVVGCAPIDSAGPNEVAFLANQKYARHLADTRAAAVIVDATIERPPGQTLLVADDPYFAFRSAMIALHGFREHPLPADGEGLRISPRAVVHESATVGSESIVHPFATIDKDAKIGSGCVIYPNVYVGVEVIVGDGCILYPGVAVYDRCVLGHRVTLHSNTVIGQDGFGYATHNGRHHKIPQHGVVVIEDDVELGAGCMIERAAMGETRIGSGTKFADLISIGHGTTIGSHCLFVSLAGVSGSVDVGDYVVLGGQVGVAGHLSIGDGVQAAAKSGIMHDIPSGSKVGGQPAIDFTKAKRNLLVSLELDQLAKRLRKLEREISKKKPST